MGSAVETVLDLRLYISEIEGRKITADNRLKSLRHKAFTLIRAQRKSGRIDFGAFARSVGSDRF